MAKTEEGGKEPVATSKPRQKINKPLIYAIIAAGVATIGLAILMYVLTFNLVVHRLPARDIHPEVAHEGPGITKERAPPAYGWREERDGTSVQGDDLLINGVVTSISGDTFVVSGNGKQITITTNTATVIKGSENAVQVNDSVLVRATKSGEVVTARSVAVRNRE